jgi:hypothetical protein
MVASIANVAKTLGISMSEATKAFESLGATMAAGFKSATGAGSGTYAVPQANEGLTELEWALAQTVAAKEAEKSYPGLTIDHMREVPTGNIPVGDEKTYDMRVSKGHGMNKVMFQTCEFEASSVAEACRLALEMASSVLDKNHPNNDDPDEVQADVQSRLEWAKRHLVVSYEKRTRVFPPEYEFRIGRGGYAKAFAVAGHTREAALQKALLRAVSELDR